MASRTVVLAVNPDVMDDVTNILRSGAMRMSEPVGGKERLRVHTLDEQHCIPLIVPRRTPAEAAKQVGMSRRLLQTLEFLAEGLPVKQIAVRMGIAEASAKTHTQRLYRFLGVNGAPLAVAEGFRLGLLTGGES
jgi:ATP/maltotriose-dependent transcriptional regulator MalT